jgi:hypothetical protein
MPSPARTFRSSRSPLLAALVAAPAPRALGGELVYVALGEQTRLGMQAGDPDRIAAVLGSTGRRVRTIDLTAPGMTSEQILREQLEAVLRLRPFLVTLAVGSADACGRTPLPRFARDLEIIADLLHRNVPNVIVSTFGPPGDACARSGAALQRRLDAFNGAIVRSVKRSRLSLADLGDGGRSDGRRTRSRQDHAPPALCGSPRTARQRGARLVPERGAFPSFRVTGRAIPAQIERLPATPVGDSPEVYTWLHARPSSGRRSGWWG